MSFHCLAHAETKIFTFETIESFLNVFDSESQQIDKNKEQNFKHRKKIKKAQFSITEAVIRKGNWHLNGKHALINMTFIEK